MSENTYNKLNTLLPVFGGASGAASQVHKLTAFFPSWETLISSIIITVVGAVIGYLVKVLLDRVFKKG